MVEENEIVGVMFTVIQEDRAQGWTAVEARLGERYHKKHLSGVLRIWSDYQLNRLTAEVWQTWVAEPDHHWRELVNRVKREWGQPQIKAEKRRARNGMSSGLILPGGPG